VAQKTWKTDISGSWWTQSNWLKGNAPHDGDDVILASGGTEYTVTIGADAGAHDLHLASLTIEAQVRLDILAAGTHHSIGVLNNAGAITIGAADGKLAHDIVVDADEVLNTGSIYLAGHLGGGPRAVLNVNDAAPAVLTSDYALTGNSLLQFASGGGIESISSEANLWVEGSHARVTIAGQTAKNAAFANLHSNAGFTMLGSGGAIGNPALSFDNSGYFYIADHTTLKAVDFFNPGRLAVDWVLIGTGGSKVAVAGALHNSGETYIGGSPENLDSPIVKVGSLDNSGFIRVGWYASANPLPCELSIRKDASNTGTVDIEETGVVHTHSWSQTAGETIVDGRLYADRISIDGGRLDGIGSIEGPVIVGAAGSVGGQAVSHYLGTLSITGNFIDSGSMNAVLIAAHPEYSGRIAVAGDKVVLKGATLNIDIQDPQNLHIGESFDILDFTPGTLKSHFQTITDGTHVSDGNSLDLGNGFTLDAIYDNAGGHLELVVEATSHLAADANGMAVHHSDSAVVHTAWPVAETDLFG
jgi:hypothetical protein